MIREKIGDLLEDGGLANPALAVDDEDVVDELARQAVLNPSKDIFTPEEHTRLNDGCPSNIRIAQIIHNKNPTL
jgi:hypothetical protein